MHKNKDAPLASLSQFKVGEFSVTAPENLITAPDGRPCTVQGKSMEVLVYLAQHAGTVVTRDELLAKVWPDRVVNEDILNQRLSELRRAFGDKATSPKYFQTVHGRGYKLIASVEDGDLRKPQRTPWRAALVLLIAAALLGLGARQLLKPPPPVPANEFLILSVENTSDTVTASLSIIEVLRQLLRQSSAVTLLPEWHVRARSERLFGDTTTDLDRERGIELALYENVGRLVHASVSQDPGGNFVVDIEVIDPLRKAVVLRQSLKGASLPDLFEQLSSFSNEIRLVMGESVQQVQSNSMGVADLTTSDPNALADMAAARRARLNDKLDEALELALDAIKKDPEYAAAHALIGRLYYGRHDSRELAQNHWRLALEHRERLTAMDAQHVEAQLSYFEAPEQMRRAWRKLRNRYPRMMRAHYELGNVHWYFFNDLESAGASYAAGEKTLTNEWANPYHEAYTHLGRGNVGTALAGFERSYARLGGYYNFGMVDALTAIGRYDDAHELLFPDGSRRKSIRKPNTKVIVHFVDRGMSAKACLELYSSSARSAQRISGQEADACDTVLRNAPVSVAIASADQTAVPDISWREMTLPVARLAIVQLHASQPQWKEAVQLELAKFIAIMNATTPSGDLPPFGQLTILVKQGFRAGHAAQAQQLLSLIKELPEYRKGLGVSAYVAIAEAEQHRANGNTVDAMEILEDMVQRYDYLQARESLAYLYRTMGRTDEALIHYDWLANHRPRAFSEALFFYGKSFNVSTWARALIDHADLLDATGQTVQARQLYQRLLDQWEKADMDHAAKAYVMTRI
jgi:DNA-binding winged helix-turn-helix (wHTH) protein